MLRRGDGVGMSKSEDRSGRSSRAGQAEQAQRKSGVHTDSEDSVDGLGRM